MMRNLAVNIRALRQLHGLSQQELGEKLGVSWRTIQNWELESHAPKFVALIWLSEIFEVTLNQLIYFPREAFEGCARDAKTGRFVLADAPRTRGYRKTSADARADGASGSVHTAEADTGK